MPGLSCGMQDLVPWLGIKPGTPGLEVQSLSHWTTREVPEESFLCWSCLISQIPPFLKVSSRPPFSSTVSLLWPESAPQFLTLSPPLSHVCTIKMGTGSCLPLPVQPVHNIAQLLTQSWGWGSGSLNTLRLECQGLVGTPGPMVPPCLHLWRWLTGWLHQGMRPTGAGDSVWHTESPYRKEAVTSSLTSTTSTPLKPWPHFRTSHILP